ncbi:MAG: chromosome segregation protein SMC [Gammaproteobacteria bacterium]|nr:MAG: chromosome segregation protein SMC [Gammaproteobacteria bacterium]
MRLKSIKLAGFKSFVDPSVVNYPTNLSCIVGPNGCGKSNVIDAVKWVMGESSAKNLRGESMTDVIFNGSSTRKPVGQASVELNFDNSDGTLAGEYGKYAEICIKRLVTREGQSAYFLNGTKCRRRDITDIFLGTGLGPRSYAIIEQGTISRLVEAKPEELRNFIEEAAGISKYKERRRDTENRMRRTRENLDRLQDIRDELERQLQHLNRQSQSAEKYKEFKEEERLKKAQLKALRWRTIDLQAKEKEILIRDAEVEFEKSLAGHQHIDTELEKLRVEYTELNDGFNQEQSKYYGIGAEIGRAEQEIQHQKQRQDQFQLDLQQDQDNLAQITDHITADREQVAELEAQLDELEPQLTEAQAHESDSSGLLTDAEEAMNVWQLDWEQYNEKAAEPQRQAQVAQSKIQHLEESIQRLRDRIIRLEREREGLAFSSIEEEMEALSEEIAEREIEVEAQQESLDEQITTIEGVRVANRTLNQAIDGLKSNLQTAKGKQASLDALQEAAMGQKDKVFKDWLEQHGFTETPRLAEQIQVESGWEVAVETVLEDHLQAICTDALSLHGDQLAEMGAGKHCFMVKGGNDLESGVDSMDAPLLAKINSSLNLTPLFHGIRAVDDFDAAMQMRDQLKPHESIVTRTGEWIGANWVQIGSSQGIQAGVLHRAQELEELGAEIDSLEAQIDEQVEHLDEKREQIRELEISREDNQKKLTEINRHTGELKAQSSARQVRLEQFVARKERLGVDLEETQEHQELEQEQLGEARIILQEAVEIMASESSRREDLVEQRDKVRFALEETRQKARHNKDLAHQLSLQSHSFKTQLNSTQQAMQRLETQQVQLLERVDQLKNSVQDNQEPDEERKARLEELLDQHVRAEDALGAARSKVEEVEQSIRTKEKGRGELEQLSHGVRSKLETLRMDWQGLEVRRKTVEEQLKEAQFELHTVLKNLPDDANEQDWDAALQRIANRITRLGAINLAAIDEYQSESERKNHLDSQFEDLVEALETLENAIKKIDKETRQRFKDTFDKINKGLQSLFPKVFGGGHAYLELTGDDLLNTGVAIMARPPGKRNSTIHLLSGGEKALTAIALVFSIFQLNPAPFCMLDEVDAPLDDANVGRFCNLVKEMSETVQFIYISHNKIAMEMAQSLMGVTMHEPGVSRLVTVDVEEASELIAV